MKRLGMRHSMTVRRSRLKMADVDWDLMDRWIEKARERATDYELVRFESRVSDEHLEQWARIKNVMNTAPREELEAADFDMTPGKWRAEEDTADIRGDDYFAIGALHRPTGEFAGLTDVFLPRHFPQQAWQEDTGVDPAHRNKGLGRWLKAEMITWIATDRPEVERIDTHNAGSNEPMLAINVEMGFKPVLIENVWQGTVDEIRAKLSTGTVAV
jgi:GNAT superfamily N-acetyltransferase